MKNSQITRFACVLLVLVLLPENSHAATSLLGEHVTLSSVSGYQYGPGHCSLTIATACSKDSECPSGESCNVVFSLETTDLPSATFTQKFIKIANDSAASGDTAAEMPEFEVKVERYDPTADTWSTFTTNELNASSNSVAAGFYNITVAPDPAAGGTFAVEKVYTITLNALNGGWAIDQPNNPRERIAIGVKNNSSAQRTYFGAAGDILAESEVPYIKVVPAAIDFGEVLCCLISNLPDPEVMTIANVGTGVLNINSYGNPLNPAFSHAGGSLPTPFPLNPLATQNLPISFTPSPTMTPGPINTTMTISSNSSGNNELTVDLSAISVKLEVVMLYDISGSMGRKPDGNVTTNPMETRIGQAKLAGLQITTLLKELEGDAVRAGLVTFPRYQTPFCFEDNGPTAFTMIPGPGNTTNVGLAEFSSVGSAFDDAWGTGANSLQIPNGANTPLAQGLKVAYGLDATNFGTGKWTEGEYVRRALLLLSDGYQYPSSCASTPRATPADWASYFESTTISNLRAIKVFSLPYGTSGDVDHVSLQRIGDATNGGFYTGDPLDFSTLYKQFRSALIDWRDDWTEVVDPTHNITKGEEKTHEVCIDDSVKRIAFIVDWKKLASSSVDFQLQGPNGVVSSTSSDVSFHSSLTNAMYVVKGETAKGNVGSDKWKMKLTGGSGLATGETTEYNYSVITKSKVSLNSDSSSHPFYTLGKQLIEVKLKGLPGEQMVHAGIRLEYDIPNESYGTWLSSMQAFDTRWLIQSDVGTTPHTKSEDKVGLSRFISTAVADEASKIPLVPTVIMGEPASLVQRKVYALSNFAKRPFQNLRSKGELKLVDNGSNGDKLAGDGIYSAYLPSLAHDGLAKFRAYLSIDSASSCLNREFRLDKLVRVALDSAVMVKNISFKDPVVSPFFPSDLNNEIVKPTPNGFQRRNVVITPKDQAGNYWGPGNADQVKFNVKNATLIGGAVDNLDGSYSQIIQYQSEATPTVSVSVSGVTTEDIQVEVERDYSWWIYLIVFILVLILIFVRKLIKNP